MARFSPARGAASYAPSMDAIRGISHVSLSVRDLDRSLDFYKGVLDLPLLAEPFIGSAFAGREALVLAGKVAVCLQEHAANDGSVFDPVRTGLDHLAFHLPSIEALEAWITRLDELGITHSGAKEVMFGTMIELRDPDGVQIELFARD
jgi:glyoxylase I family protein